MLPYEDSECICYKEEAKIRKEYPTADWNMDEACSAWNKVADTIPSNNIEFGQWEEGAFGCTCPSCGRMVCGWCV